MSESDKLIDHRFNILSYEQYQKDLAEKKFTKICLTEVVNADMMIATHGEEKYFRTSREILHMGNEAYKQMGLDSVIHVYIHSYKSFMAVANDDMSDEDFLGLMKANYEQYEIITAQSTEIGGISRFVIAFGDNLIDRAKSAFYVHQHEQTNFIVATDEKEKLEAEKEKNIAIFELLHYAIKNDKIIPYYQGIHNNDTNEIIKYEALMRVQDKDGKIYPPGMFLEASKTLKLYLQLSKTMLDKAMKDFEHKESELSLNVSLFDIQSKDFKEWFIERVKQHPDPSKIIIEFVETENYNDEKELEIFLAAARDIGCKIAIDDFGVGFATYTSIMSLRPDIIKIDGDIIKNLATSKESKLIVDAICYMARLIGAYITAEFVENAEIQQILKENNVHFSQGYHFAKPEPFENLKVQ